jgi:hypothetical protein
MPSLWATMLSHWLGRPAELAAADASDIAVRRQPAAAAAAAPLHGARTARDPVPAIDDIEAARAPG